MPIFGGAASQAARKGLFSREEEEALQLAELEEQARRIALVGDSFGNASSGVLKPSVSALGKALGFLDKGRQAVFNTFIDPLVPGEQEGVGDVVEAVAPGLPLWLKRGVGFVGDVATDPLTYVTAGAGSVAKTAAASTVAEQLAARNLRRLGDDASTRLADDIERGVAKVSAQTAKENPAVKEAFDRVFGKSEVVEGGAFQGERTPLISELTERLGDDADLMKPFSGIRFHVPFTKQTNDLTLVPGKVTSKVSKPVGQAVKYGDNAAARSYEAIGSRLSSGFKLNRMGSAGHFARRALDEARVESNKMASEGRTFMKRVVKAFDPSNENDRAVLGLAMFNPRGLEEALASGSAVVSDTQRELLDEWKKVRANRRDLATSFAPDIGDLGDAYDIRVNSDEFLKARRGEGIRKGSRHYNDTFSGQKERKFATFEEAQAAGRERFGIDPYERDPFKAMDKWLNETARQLVPNRLDAHLKNADLARDSLTRTVEGTMPGVLRRYGFADSVRETPSGKSAKVTALDEAIYTAWQLNDPTRRNAELPFNEAAFKALPEDQRNALMREAEKLDAKLSQVRQAVSERKTKRVNEATEKVGAAWDRVDSSREKFWDVADETQPKYFKAKASVEGVRRRLARAAEWETAQNKFRELSQDKTFQTLNEFTRARAGKRGSQELAEAHAASVKGAEFLPPRVVLSNPLLMKTHATSVKRKDFVRRWVELGLGTADGGREFWTKAQREALNNNKFVPTANLYADPSLRELATVRDAHFTATRVARLTKREQRLMKEQERLEERLGIMPGMYGSHARRPSQVLDAIEGKRQEQLYDDLYEVDESPDLSDSTMLHVVDENYVIEYDGVDAYLLDATTAEPVDTFPMTRAEVEELAPELDLDEAWLQHLDTLREQTPSHASSSGYVSPEAAEWQKVADKWEEFINSPKRRAYLGFIPPTFGDPYQAGGYFRIKASADELMSPSERPLGKLVHRTFEDGSIASGYFASAEDIKRLKDDMRKRPEHYDDFPMAASIEEGDPLAWFEVNSAGGVSLWSIPSARITPDGSSLFFDTLAEWKKSTNGPMARILEKQGVDLGGKTPAEWMADPANAREAFKAMDLVIRSQGLSRYGALSASTGWNMAAAEAAFKLGDTTSPLGRFYKAVGKAEGAEGELTRIKSAEELREELSNIGWTPTGRAARAYGGTKSTVPEGWARMPNGSFAPTDIAQGVADLFDRPQLYRNAWDDYTAMFKRWATMPWPGFHLRNNFGAWFNNYIGGVKNEDYYRTMRSLFNKSNDADTFMEGMTVGEFRQMLEDDGISLRSIRDALSNKDSATGSQLLEAMGNPTRKPAFGVPGVSRVAEKWQELGGSASEAVETLHRATAYAAGLRKFRSRQAAREFTFQRHGDYTDLTPTEEHIKRFIPFYKWARTNIPLQAQTLLENPGRALAGHRFVQDVVGDEDAQNDLALGGVLPFAMGESRVMLGPDRVVDVDLPFYQLNDVSVAGALNSLNPLLKVGIEATTGTRLSEEGIRPAPSKVPAGFQLAPVAKVFEMLKLPWASRSQSGELWLDSRIATALNSVPGVQVVDRLMGLATEGGLTSNLTGFRATSYDEEDQQVQLAIKKAKLNELVKDIYRLGYGEDYVNAGNEGERSRAGFFG